MVSNKSVPKLKQYYTVKMETQAPLILTYKVYAESAEQAVQMVLAKPLENWANPPKPILSKLKQLKAQVYLAGNSVVQLVKNFF